MWIHDQGNVLHDGRLASSTGVDVLHACDERTAPGKENSSVLEWYQACHALLERRSESRTFSSQRRVRHIMRSEK